MSAERTKILEMLSEGKITVEEATRLLEALSGSAEDRDDGSAPHNRERARSRRRKRQHFDWVDSDTEGVEQEIHERIAQARETLRASMPRVRRAIDDSLPEIDRAVKEATGSIPDIGRIVRDAVRAAGGAISSASRSWRNTDYPHQAEREDTEKGSLESGDRLAVRNPMGHLKIEVWDRPEVEILTHTTVSATDQTQAEAFLEQVTIKVDREPKVTRIQPAYPDRDGNWDCIGPVRVDFLLRVPGRVDLDLSTAHGDIEIPEIEGAAVLKCRHGNTSATRITGNTWVNQAHGNVGMGRAGAELTLEARHGNVSIETIEGSGKLNVQHGNLAVNSVGRSAEIAIAHGNLTVNGAANDVSLTSGHGSVLVTGVAGNLEAKAAHGSLDIRSVSGNVKAVNRHDTTNVTDVAGNVVADNAHGNITVANVAGSITAATRHSGVRLSRAAGGVTVENDHGSIDLEEINGPITASNSKGTIRIDGAHDTITLANRQGRTRIDPRSPIQSRYAIQASGEVELVVPDGSEVDVAGHARHGRVRSDWALEVEDDGRDGQTVKGRIGEGGATLAMEVTRGDLVLKRGVAPEQSNEE